MLKNSYMGILVGLLILISSLQAAMSNNLDTLDGYNGVSDDTGNTPYWTDGLFFGNVSMQSDTSGTVKGFISLGRSDGYGKFNGTYTKVLGDILEFQGRVMGSLILGIAHDDSVFMKPFIGMASYENQEFSAKLFILGSAPLTIEGQYYASFLPHPSGMFALGKEEIYLKDESREEQLTENPDDKRELMLEIWYPTDDINTLNTEEYMGTETFEWIRQQGPIPLFWIPKHAYSFVQTHAYEQARVAEAAPMYPIIIFSHGYRGFPSLYTSMIEDLASHGYIIVAITHPYVAGMTVFPDGRTIELPELPTDDANYSQWFFETAYDEVLGDIHFVLDYLEILNITRNKFNGKLDLSRIGMYGHSFGGSATASLCYSDERVDVGMTLDSSFDSSITDDGLVKPFLMIFVENRFDDSPNLQLFWNKLQADSYRIDIAGSEHQDYTDLPILLKHLSPSLPRNLIPGFGTIDGKRLAAIVNLYSLKFFNAYLKDGDIDDILKIAYDFEEISFFYK